MKHPISQAHVKLISSRKIALAYTYGHSVIEQIMDHSWEMAPTVLSLSNFRSE